MDPADGASVRPRRYRSALRHLRHVVALPALLACAAAAPAPPPSPSASPSSLAQLAWMSGCWRISSPERTVEEQWMTPEGGVMLGMGRTLVEDRVLAYEHMLIREEAGRIVFLAIPSGQAAAEFEAVERTDASITFAAPHHDFPQRVLYRRGAAGDSLHARIEGTIGGVERTVEFPFARVDCP